MKTVKCHGCPALLEYEPLLAEGEKRLPHRHWRCPVCDYFNCEPE